jgi:hypothetical protein
MPQLFVGFGATPLVDELLGGTQPEERFVRDDAHALEEIRGSAKVSGSSSRVTGAPNSAITASANRTVRTAQRGQQERRRRAASHT